MLGILTGFSAKALCSCHFISERSLEDIANHELSVASFASHSIDYDQQISSSSFLGVKRQAIYRAGRGCTLLSEMTAEELKSQETVTYKSGMSTFDFPKDTSDLYPALQGVIDQAFEEPYSDKAVNTRAVLVIKDGVIIGEQYKEGYHQQTAQMGWSMTKSVTNALVGILTQKTDLDIYAPAPISAWHEKSDDPRQAVTLDQLLRMSSGLAFEEDYGSDSDVNRMLWTKADAARVAYSQKLVHEPDTQWYYSSGTTNIISKIIRDQFPDQTSYLKFPYESLFSKLGMSTAIMETDPSGTYVGSSLMYASARDWAKFGQLYLNDGIWNGERILPEGWVEYSITPTKTTSPYDYYGAHFWINAKKEPPAGSAMPSPWVDVPADAYYASGFEGQTILLLPSENMVIVRLGQTLDRSAWDIGAFAGQIIKSTFGIDNITKNEILK